MRGAFSSYHQFLFGFCPIHAAFLDQCPEGCVIEVIDVAYEYN